MKKLLLTMGLVLTSPLLLAQGGNQNDDQKQKSTTPATPAIPATPASPALGQPEVQGPTKNEDGSTSGSAKSGRQSAGATGNPDTKSGKARTRNDFGALDSNGDNKISQDELRVNVQLGTRFSEADANRDGSLSRGEFSKLESLTGSSGNTGRDSEGRDSQKQEQTEGSDRTDKDDQLNRNLPGQ